MERVIFVEPKIDEEEIIDIFKTYNPDSSFVNPHICLVFPFESDLETYELESIINKVFDKYNSFDIKLCGLSISYEEKNNFLFLNVIDEEDILRKMSNELYNYLGSNAKLRGEYIPHITLGKSKSIDEINDMYSNAEKELKSNYNTIISCIYCKKIIQDTKGNISLENEISKQLDDHNKRI